MPISRAGYNGDFFPQPEPFIIGPATRVMSLRDGTKKMSKSDPSDLSRINLYRRCRNDCPKKIRKAKTDTDGLPSEAAGLKGPARGRKPGRHLCGAFGKHGRPGSGGNSAAGSFPGLKQALAELAVAKLGPIGQ